MSRFPGDGEPTADQFRDVLTLPPSATWAIRQAQTFTLRTAMTMLQAQIQSRRAMIGTGALTPEALDQTAREIQRRVERIRLIVAELRGRGLEVEWDE